MAPVKVSGRGVGSEFEVDRHIKPASCVDMHGVLQFSWSQSAESQSAHNLSVFFQGFGHHGRSDVHTWSQVSSQDRRVSGVLVGRVMEHNPLVLFILIDLAYISSLPLHLSFRGIAIEVVYIVGSMRSNQGHQFKAVVHNGLGEPDLSILQELPRFNSRMLSLHVFDQAEYGSISRLMQSASRSF